MGNRLLQVRNPHELLEILLSKNMLLVPHEDTIFGSNGADHDDFALPVDVEPFLFGKELEGDLTAEGIALWWAPDPYCRRSGRMRRAQDLSW